MVETSITRKQLYTGEPRASHSTHSDRMAEHAKEQLDKGDRVQASEKAWGAVVHELARIARQKGKRLDSHGAVKDFIRQLADKHNDRMLWLLAGAVENAHTNFYKDTMKPSDIKLAIEASEQLRFLLRRYEPRPPRKRAATVRRTPPRR